MSSSIVIALPKIEDAKKIRTILNRHGLTVASVCSSVSNALASISELDSGVLICGYKLTDAYYKDALDNLPQYFEMLLLASQRIIDEAPNSVSAVQMPMKASVLIDTVNDMLYHLERRIKKEKKKPKPRSEKEQNYISNAKRLLMENRHLSKAVASEKFYEFREKLMMKCHEERIELRVVSRWYPSSRKCHSCGCIRKDLKLSDRIYRCSCGYVEDRDRNAALNLKDAETYEIA